MDFNTMVNVILVVVLLLLVAVNAAVVRRNRALLRQIDILQGHIQHHNIKKES